jgi:nitrate reductase / nitrite oxidoreductase, alpha subunit
MMWGSNVPVTRTPDAHWMTEVRYRGTKIVTVSPDYADNTKFADEWLPAQAGTDAALAMAMGHVILKEFFVDRQVPFFTDYVKTYTDLPFLITLTENAEHGGLVPGKFLTEMDLEPTANSRPEASWKQCCWMPPPASRLFRTVRWASAMPTPVLAAGTWIWRV